MAAGFTVPSGYHENIGNANSTTLADGPRWVYQEAPPGAYRGVNLGSNGWDTDPASDQDSYIFGAFCIRKDQHCHGYTGN